MNTLKSPVVGTELKIKVGLKVGGTEWKDLPEDSPFTLYFYTGRGEEVAVQGTAPGDINDDDNTFLAIVDTEHTGAGNLQMKIVIDVADQDMAFELIDPTSDDSAGYRREVAIYNTGVKIYDA